jgi:hypothetical protein
MQWSNPLTMQAPELYLIVLNHLRAVPVNSRLRGRNKRPIVLRISGKCLLDLSNRPGYYAAADLETWPGFRSQKNH